MTSHLHLSRLSHASRALVASLALVALPVLAAGQGGVHDHHAVGPRAMYVWDTSIPSDRGKTKELIRFALRHGIDALYLESALLGYGGPDAGTDYARFVDIAHTVDIEVFALVGNPWFCVPAGAGVPGQPTNQDEGLALHFQIMTSGVEFDGVVENSLPYLTDYDQDGVSGNWFWENLPYSAQDYLDYLRGVELVIGDTPFRCAIPFWFDSDPRLDLVLEASPSARPLNSYVSDIVDVTNVLSYRDHAQGPDGILQLSLGEVFTGPATIGVETMDLGQSWSYLTFWEEGPGVLEQELLKVWYVHRTNPNFRGFTLHYYGSYQELAN